jgi:cytochrome c oxidase cbb3-type subunit 3
MFDRLPVTDSTTAETAADRCQHPPRRLRRIRNRTQCAVWIGAGIASLILAAIVSHLIEQSDLRSRLMRSDPDTIANDHELQSFASHYAQPLYDRHCNSCHGNNMQGDRLKGVPNLTDAEWLYGTGRVAEIERTILYGIRAGLAKTKNLAGMPAFAQAVPYSRYEVQPLQPNEIGDVVEFLLAAAGRSGDADAAHRGRIIFAGKAQCADCHASDAQGDNAIGAPNLVDDIWLYGNGTREDIYISIARGHNGVCPPWFQILKPHEVRALAVYVHKAGRARTDSPSSIK